MSQRMRHQNDENSSSLPAGKNPSSSVLTFQPFPFSGFISWAKNVQTTGITLTNFE